MNLKWYEKVCKNCGKPIHCQYELFAPDAFVWLHRNRKAACYDVPYPIADPIQDYTPPASLPEQ